MVRTGQGRPKGHWPMLQKPLGHCARALPAKARRGRMKVWNCILWLAFSDELSVGLFVLERERR
jgi:hypothetical protein